MQSYNSFKIVDRGHRSHDTQSSIAPVHPKCEQGPDPARNPKTERPCSCNDCTRASLHMAHMYKP